MRLLCLPILHPTYILRGKFGLETAQVTYLTRMKALMDGAPPNLIDVNEPPPKANLFPTIDELYEFAGGPIEQGLAVDLEAAGPHPICIGFTRLADLAYVCVRFRAQGGRPWWRSYRELELAVSWTDGVLSDPSIPKIMHNGQGYDFHALSDVGFRVAGFLDDTIVMANVWFGEQPKGLEFLGGLLAEIPRWKYLVDDKDEADGKG